MSIGDWQPRIAAGASRRSERCARVGMSRERSARAARR